MMFTRKKLKEEIEMKNKGFMLILLLSMLALIMSSCASGGGKQQEAIVINCPNLEEAIRNADGYTGAPIGPIYPEDVLGITVLDVNNLSMQRNEDNVGLMSCLAENMRPEKPSSRNVITSLGGIEYLTNLATLTFYNNQVDDISPLENLTNLETLRFGENLVSDLSPLQNLTNLKDLSFHYNQVSDISVLENLTNLKTIAFSGNQISDISPLENLTSLEWLFFHENQISDISPLQNLINLTRLVFYTNLVNDISALENLTDLSLLIFYQNKVSDISSLVANTGLGAGDEIKMDQNFLNLTKGSQNMQDIQTLIDRGCIVSYEPQLDNMTPELVSFELNGEEGTPYTTQRDGEYLLSIFYFDSDSPTLTIYVKVNEEEWFDITGENPMDKNVGIRTDISSIEPIQEGGNKYYRAQTYADDGIHQTEVFKREWTVE